MRPTNADDAVTRRRLIAALGAGAVATAAAPKPAAAAGAAFTHGVASGDPLHTSVIIWTRAQSVDGAPVSLEWQLSDSERFATVLRRGITSTDASRDFTVKVEVTDLEPGRIYFYRFVAGTVVSPVGRTRTWPDRGTAPVNLALMSCSNFGFGYFNVYRDCAARDDIDAVVHVGDYIYEYGPATYADKAMEDAGRMVEPRREIVSLADYRQRYATYRGDPDLQEIHRRLPFIVVWDDHEITNDAFNAGAENHQPAEGDYAARKRAALRAYFEGMPIRPLSPDAAGRIYRSFEIGDLATLAMLDTRIYGRERPPSYTTDVPLVAQLTAAGATMPVPFDTTTSPSTAKPELSATVAGDKAKLPPGHGFMPDFDAFRRNVLNAPRSILGGEQEAWLRATLAASKARGVPWQILGQQTLIGTLVPVDPAPLADPGRKPMVEAELLKFVPVLERNGLPLLLDTWGGGYPTAKAALLADLKAHAANSIVLTGDSHNAWSFAFKDDTGETLAVEFGCASVTSPGLETYMAADPAKMTTALKARNPDLLYCEVGSRGYTVVRLSEAAVTAEFVVVDTVKKRDFTARVDRRLTVNPRGPAGAMTVAAM
ncbi:MAG: alkaline phosphatase D family protein [Rhodospirillaceae bacterium]|nr:alkaline phosphatase D family protein [Rhodospirillaceae bacterium]